MSPFEVGTDTLVVKMPTRFMTGVLLRSRCGDKLHMLGWSWVVEETHWWGEDTSTPEGRTIGCVKQVTLVRLHEKPISPLEAIRTNCYPTERE